MQYGPLVKRLRQRPLTPLTSVRFRYGSPYCSLAQSVERMTVNHDVVSSSLTGAAIKSPEAIASGFFLFYHTQKGAAAGCKIQLTAAPFFVSLFGAKLPERHRTGRRHIQGIYPVGHGNFYCIITGCHRLCSQAFAFCSHDHCQFFLLHKHRIINTD